MVEKSEFTQENVDSLISEVKALPANEREEIAKQVKLDLRGWLLETFIFTPKQEACMVKWPQSMREETGFGLGTALQYENWNLIIEFPNPPEQPIGTAKKKHEQSVSGQYNTQSGSYTVTKTHKWSW